MRDLHLTGIPTKVLLPVKRDLEIQQETAILRTNPVRIPAELRQYTSRQQHSPASGSTEEIDTQRRAQRVGIHDGGQSATTAKAGPQFAGNGQVGAIRATRVSYSTTPKHKKVKKRLKPFENFSCEIDEFCFFRPRHGMDIRSSSLLHCRSGRSGLNSLR